MSLSDVEIAEDLATAGLVFLGRVLSRPALPAEPGRSAASSLPEHGRFDSPEVSIYHPEFASRINADWGRMAVEYGLFDSRREFLLGVDLREPGAVNGEYGWVRVRLLDRWDVAGSACRQLRGWSFETERGELWVPEFSALSLDSRMLIHTTLWGSHTVSTIVIRPDRVVSGLQGRLG